jgi:hypothetical protein
LTFDEPVVDGVSGDAELRGGVFDADLAVLDGHCAGCPDLVGVAGAGDSASGEWFAFAGEQAGGVEPFGELLAGVRGAVAADQFEGTGGVRPGPCRSAVSSSVAPVCQRTPIRTLSSSVAGSRVISAIRLRSSRLRSR